MNEELIVAKISDLILNRVDNVRWFYFEIFLDNLIVADRAAAAPPNDPANIMTPILEKMTMGAHGNYSFDLESGLLPVQGNLATLQSRHLLSLLEYLRLRPDILSTVMKRIFDMNNVLQDSGAIQSARTSASTGLLKTFNDKEQKHRDKVFDRKFRRNPAFRNDPDHVVALAEGDSWFCFPKIHLPGFRWLFTDAVHDIIDHLIDDEDYAVSSLAAGGDWLNNMLDDNNQRYVENLSLLMPDAFFVSGGGNDLVTDHRIAHMVRTIPMEGKRDLFGSNDPVAEKIRRALMPLRLEQNGHPIDHDLYKRGITLVSDDFFRFVNVCMVQYFALFYRLLIKTDKFKGMLILTHGYDFAIPNKSRSGWFWQWKRTLNSNWAMDSGKWLFDALAMRGMADPEDQRAAVYVMIYEFNEMLGQLARFSWFPNVFHIDCRGVAQSPDDWFDELHLKSPAFKKVADTYKACIRQYKPIFRQAAMNNAAPRLNPADKVVAVNK